MKRKGLSQILYLIIAASVLMMIAMVITFTATDIIGGAGSGATQRQCTNTLQGTCTASQAEYVSLPSSCVTDNDRVISSLDSSNVGNMDGGGTGCNPTGSGTVAGCEYDCNPTSGPSPS